MNVLEAMQQELANFNQFFYHVTLAVIFQVKSWSSSTFCCFVHWELVSTQLKNNPAFYLTIRQSFFNFLSCPLFIVQSKSAESAEIFHFPLLKSYDMSNNFLEILKTIDCVKHVILNV